MPSELPPSTNSNNPKLRKLRHNIYLLQTFQVLLLFLLQSVLLLCYSAHSQSSSHTSKGVHSASLLLHLLSTPLSTIAVVLVATNAHRALLIVYLPFRYLYLFLLVGAALEIALLVYLPLLLLELCLQAALHAYVLRIFKIGTGYFEDSESNSESPPPYGEVVGVGEVQTTAAAASTVVKSTP